MGRSLDAGKILVEMQKHLLRQFFRQRPVPQEMISNAENHYLMFLDNLGEARLVALDCFLQCNLKPVFLLSVQTLPPCKLTRKRKRLECIFLVNCYNRTCPLIQGKDGFFSAFPAIGVTLELSICAT